MNTISKLILSSKRVEVPVAEVRKVGLTLMCEGGCNKDYAGKIIDHLIEADLSGVESHGIMRVLQYHDEYQRGYILPNVIPKISAVNSTNISVDGQGGLGIPALQIATEAGIDSAKTNGITAIAVRNTGHTGRLGAFAENAAQAGCLFIACGGGARDRSRMVTPYGGRKALLPTNPWCLGIPGGSLGPVVLDCATSQIAGGWIYAAKRAGATLPKGAIVDCNGRPTQNPNDYFAGGAILPKGGVLGYGLATMGELICDAMLGPATVESNTFILMVDTLRYREEGALKDAAEAILQELRDCPAADGFDRVEVPGERERTRRDGAHTIKLPEKIWSALQAGGEI